MRINLERLLVLVDGAFNLAAKLQRGRLAKELVRLGLEISRHALQNHPTIYHIDDAAGLPILQRSSSGG